MSDLTKTRRNPGGLGEVFSMAYPTVITMFSLALMGAADTVMVGCLGTAELGSVGFANILYFTTLALFMGVVEIVNTFASQAFGSGNLKETSKSCWQGMYIALLAWPVLLLVGWGYGDLFRLLGPSSEVQALGSAYGKIRLYASGPFLGYIALVFFFRGVGMVKTPMVAAIVMNLVNLFFDYALIFGKLGLPAMGVRGAAWASNLGVLAAVALLLAIFFRAPMHGRFGTRSSWGLDPRLLLRMLRVGVPAGLQFFLEVASFTVFISFIGRMGDVALAASQAALQIEYIGFNVCWGFTVATNTLVGQYIGAGRPDLAVKSVKSAARMVGAYLLVLLAVVSLFPTEMIGLFTDDERVFTGGVAVLYLAMSWMFFDGMGMIAVGALRGAGDTRWPMMVALVGGWFFFLPLAYLAGKVMAGGMIGAWAAAAVYIIAAATAYVLRFRGGKWKKMKI